MVTSGHNTLNDTLLSMVHHIHRSILLLVFHNAYITAANKKDAIQKLEEKIDNPIIINIILLSEDSDIIE